MESFRLTQKEMIRLAEKYPTPFVVISLTQIERNYAILKEHLPRVNVYYAMKANPAPRIVKTLYRLGASFDTASAGEIEFLSRLGIEGARVIYANPVKTPGSIAIANTLGVRKYTYDDMSEIEKLARLAPGADVMVRIRVKNQKALVDLNAKFGAPPEEAIELLKAAKKAGLNPAGICFHVGSQSTAAEAYEEALLLTRKLFNDAEKCGMHLTMLDIGGGFPIPKVGSRDADVAEMMDSIEHQIERLFPDTEIWCEPGRFICGTAVNLVTSVIGTKTRNGKKWYWLDEGLYGTFSGAIYDHWTFDFESFKPGIKEPVTFLGPSCDSIDFVRYDVMMPNLEMGDLVLVPDCGSYTTASATTFNGFPLATQIYFEDEEVAAERRARENISEIFEAARTA